jgi:tRNA threonylcarbamoyladenosine biosynthesis protein TsaB
MVRILALETSTGRGSIALLNQAELLEQSVLPPTQRTAQTLAPAIDQACRRVGWSPSSIDLVALTKGPGSFTGLRIAVTAAKTFAYFARADLIALSTLDVLVHQLPDRESVACALMDAQRRQFFASVYRRGEDRRWETISACQVLDHDQLTDLLPPGAVLTGPAVAKLDLHAWANHRRADPAAWFPQAATVGLVAWHSYQAGRRDDLLRLTPDYYRPSYAEEKRGPSRATG